MYQVKKIKQNLFWVGGNDRRLALFEGVYHIPRGVSYNAYLLLDEKTVLLDTVDKAISGLFFENLAYVLKDRPLDYVIVNHMEPDHCAQLPELVFRYPEVKIVCNQKTQTMIKNFFTFDIDSRIVLVEEGGTLCSGVHTFTFVMAPMVHWPEVMVTYDITDKILYSADAFGTFGALPGNIFADELDFERDWLDDARRYYTNIVGKYGEQVQAILEKAAKLDIAMICPLHGPIWRKNFSFFMEKYQRWATNTPEDNAVMIVYNTVYGNTENAVNILAGALDDRGIRRIVVYDVSVTDSSVIVSEAFRCSHIVFAATTYNANIFIKMEEVLLDIKEHKLKNRTVAFIENGSWAPLSGAQMRELFSSLENITILENTVTIKSSVKDSDLAALNALADSIVASMPKSAVPAHDVQSLAIEPAAFFKLSYGLFLLSAKDGAKDNACIINTAAQLTDTPKRVNIAVIKRNYTCEMILKTGVFNVSVLTTDAAFKVFQHFGFQSGRDMDKLAGSPIALKRSENGLVYSSEGTNAFFSCKVISSTDYGTHVLFTADVTEAAVLANTPSLTYQYYFDQIKPKPPFTRKKKRGWVCKVCGYIHEGDELPPDFLCPLCKHGADDFEPIA
ncbi:MAG: flavin reductase [Treponema sp.]|jgi:flavorubredoxin/flavin reductase (DIM6/NTAB) family NADH-FMN oxidoreductase RutF/rubredoxin|nr:flavin reductase [Treponema sp.]